MTRLTPATRDSVPSEQTSFFDAMVERLGSVPTYGPGSATIHVPEACQMVYELSDLLRDRSSLSTKIRELAMLVTARELDCQHIWNAHAPAGRTAGLSDEVVAAVRDKGSLAPLPADEASVVNYGREFFRTHKVSRGAFQSALEQFGTRGIVELTLLMGTYSMLTFVVNAFDPELAPNSPEPVLPI